MGPAHRPRGGLSPRVRGNPRLSDVYDLFIGSIPACAGEPCELVYQLFQPKVYPRVCGGTAPLVGPSAPDGGLSPRVRGNPIAFHHDVARDRSIPACAGEPRVRPGALTGTTVYPRVCGGTPPSRPGVSQHEGLSPRVRGNLPISQGHGDSQRSIPACAGEPILRERGYNGGTVYPRVCGGT